MKTFPLFKLRLPGHSSGLGPRGKHVQLYETGHVSFARQRCGHLPPVRVPRQGQGSKLHLALFTEHALRLYSYLGETQFRSQSSGKEQVDAFKDSSNGQRTGNGQSTLSNIKDNDARGSMKILLYH